MPYEEAAATAKALAVDVMNEVFVVLAKYGDVDVPGLREQLDL